MPEPTTATRPGARPPDFAAIALRGYFISQPTYKRNHKQTGTILRVDSREILLSTCNTSAKSPSASGAHEGDDESVVYPEPARGGCESSGEIS